MRPCPFSLNLVMKLIHVMGQRQENRFCLYVHDSTAQEPAEPAVLLQIPEGSFLLDALVHPQFTALLTHKPFQILFSVLVKLFRYIEYFTPFFQWLFAVVSLYTFLFIRASITSLARVNSYLPHVSCFGLFTFHMAGKKRFPIAAGITVC